MVNVEWGGGRGGGFGVKGVWNGLIVQLTAENGLLFGIRSSKSLQ